MDLFLQLALNGVVEGMRYGLVALGFALVLSVTGYVHFAHGAICESLSLRAGGSAEIYFSGPRY